MNITESIVKMIEKEGIILSDRKDVYKTIDDAINLGTFNFIRHEDKNIGFFTWFVRADGIIFINNMLIFKAYRGKLNLRKYIWSIFGKTGAFSWRNRKTQKDVLSKGERYALANN